MSENENVNTGEQQQAHDYEQAMANTSAYSIATSLVMVMAQKAWVNLGKIAADPKANELKVDLPQAKFAIDVIAAVYEPLKPHISAEESGQIQALLTNLRLNYVSSTK